MFGFRTKNDEVMLLNQKVGRFLSHLVKSDLDSEYRRGESRARVGVPCLIFLLKELKGPRSYAVGFTSDVSLHGMGMYLADPLENDEYILVFGQNDVRTYVAAKCNRCIKAEFGTYSAAFTFLRALSPKEIGVVKEAAESLEARLAAPVATPVPAHVMAVASGHFAL